jgi:hypothetical protein
MMMMIIIIINITCRLCQQFDETTEHIISACPILANEHTHRDMILHVLNYTLTYARK